MRRTGGLFARILAFDNLLAAERRAARGKRDRAAVARFEFHLERELIALQEALQEGSYRPGGFCTFEVRDPKRRAICAAPFRDRVLHHAVCDVLEPVFERRSIYDGYACRRGKGTHAAIARAQQLSRRWPFFLKCDVRRFFASVDHAVLKRLLARLFKEPELLALLDRIIDHGPPEADPGLGLPIGNLTSQHFANLYLGELDHHLKDRLRVKGYLRYMDDMLLFAENKPGLYLLDYIDSPVLRRNVQKALNHGEAYHQLRRAIAYAHGGHFRAKSQHEQEVWNECARLVGNAVASADFWRFGPTIPTWMVPRIETSKSSRRNLDEALQGQARVVR